MTASPETAPQYFRTLLGWAVYLACSWTWCIGMYLPVVLRDHYGWPAVLAFAIPNVAGVVLFAVGVGTVARSRALIAGHKSAMLWFSLITIAFHVYFLGAVWGYEVKGAGWVAALLVPLPVLTLAWLTRTFSDRVLVRAALVVYILSFVLMNITGVIARGAGEQLREAVWTVRPESGVVFLIPVFVIGFLLCPWLDLTFHRALVAVGGRGAGKTTFALFGFLFAHMLVFTFFYSITGFIWPVIVHILIQSWFTMTVHFKELQTQRASAAGEAVGRWVGPVLLASWLLVFVPLVDYRWWFLFTGLVFPAYAALMMLRPRLGRPSAHQIALASVILLLTPFSALGFLRGGMEWLTLIPCVTLILSLFVGGQHQPVAGEPAESLPPPSPVPAG